MRQQCSTSSLPVNKFCPIEELLANFPGAVLDLASIV
jgi:hypothetical protein